VAPIREPEGTRPLVVVADDYGIGPETSRGILELACEGRITATVLLVNTPYAEDAVTAWRKVSPPAELGWHPNLTLDRPVLPASSVPSLVAPCGRFWPLGRFLRRVLTGRLRATEIEAELAAQYRRFVDLVGRSPPVVNTHQHVGLFGPVGRLLRGVLTDQFPRPFVRQVRESIFATARVPGPRLKRFILSSFGRLAARRWGHLGFPACQFFAGITDPPHVADPQFFARWLRRTPGHSVELMCHPGYRDETLIRRDCTADNDCVARRARELRLLRSVEFVRAMADAGFRLAAPSEIGRRRPDANKDGTVTYVVGTQDGQRTAAPERGLSRLR
jgi:predicted glycoside hydrolase/deacetylase ChbG (UPF0249 family)